MACSQRSFTSDSFRVPPVRRDTIWESSFTRSMFEAIFIFGGVGRRRGERERRGGIGWESGEGGGEERRERGAEGKGGGGVEEEGFETREGL